MKKMHTIDVQKERKVRFHHDIVEYMIDKQMPSQPSESQERFLSRSNKITSLFLLMTNAPTPI